MPGNLDDFARGAASPSTVRSGGAVGPVPNDARLARDRSPLYWDRLVNANRLLRYFQYLYIDNFNDKKREIGSISSHAWLSD
jgi:hypothetical protein